MFPSVPSGKCEAEGDDDMALPTHLICWLSPAPAEWDDEATLSDADFTGFITPPEIPWGFHSLLSPNHGWFRQEKVHKLRSPTVLVSDNAMVLQWKEAFNGKTLKTAQAGATPTLLQTYRFQCLWSHTKDPTDIQMALSLVLQDGEAKLWHWAKTQS